MLPLRGCQRKGGAWWVSSDNPPRDSDASSFTNDSRTLFCDRNLLLKCYFYRRVQKTALLFLQLLSVFQSTAPCPSSRFIISFLYVSADIVQPLPVPYFKLAVLSVHCAIPFWNSYGERDTDDTTATSTSTTTVVGFAVVVPTGTAAASFASSAVDAAVAEVLAEV